MILKILQIKKTFAILFLIIAASVFFSSCEKEDTGDFVKQAEITSMSLELDLETIRLSMLFHKAIHDTALMNHDTAFIDSAFVTLSTNSLTNQKTFTYDYGDGQVCPDWNTRSGKIIANYMHNPSNGKFILNADFNAYKFESFVMDGELSMSDSVESNVAGIQFACTANFQSYDANGVNFLQNSNKIFTWTKGFDKPYNWEGHEFLASGSANANYKKSEEAMVAEAELHTTIIEDWAVRLSCGKIINTGTLEVQFINDGTSELLTGAFIDADIDGCSDKVILKNSANFGYPFYF